MQTLRLQRAPLALSADGKWRIHADAANILYRISLSDPARTRKIALPVSPMALAVSHSGLRVAFVSAWQCVGLVDFPADPQGEPILTWKPVPYPQTSQPEAMCNASGDTIAMSDDGKLLATPTEVVDIDKKKLIATLAPGAAAGATRTALHLSFMEHDTKLLAATAALGAGYEYIGVPSSLQFAVWNLADKSLQRFSAVDGTSFWKPLALIAHYAPGSRTLYWFDAERYRTGADKPVPLALMEQSLASCNAKPVSRFALPEAGYDNVVLDPGGRWLSVTRALDGEHGTRPVKGFAAELVVFEIATGRQIERQLLTRALAGLVPSADGGTLYGLVASPVNPETGARASYGGELVKISLSLAKLTAAAAARAPGWNSAACALDNEAPQARSVALGARLLKPLWSAPLSSLEQLAAPRQQAAMEDAPYCAQRASEARVVVRRDASIWLNRYSDLVRLDPLSGKIADTRAVPRKEPACNVLPHSGDGYVSYEGDTAVYRLLDQPQLRRVLDVRPGWTVTDAYFHGRALVLWWVAKEGTRVHNDESGTPMTQQIVTYDAGTLKIIGTRKANAEAVAYAGDESEAALLEYYLKPCHDAAGAIEAGYDWRMSHFDSFRAFACTPGAADQHTVFWWHMDIAPASARERRSENDQRRVWPHDGNLAVAQVGDMLHVFDIAQRRELARIATHGIVTSVHVIARSSLVLVETDESLDSGARKLSAYSLQAAGQRRQ